MGLNAQPPPGTDVSGGATGIPHPSSQPTSLHPVVVPSASGCTCWWSRTTCSHMNMRRGAKMKIMKMRSAGMAVISLSSACASHEQRQY